MRRQKGVITLEIPKNHPNVHKIPTQQLLDDYELQELLDLCTTLNNKSTSGTRSITLSDVDNSKQIKKKE
jgi:hypothetical protein